MNTVKLNNGVTMPQLGFGVWQVPDAEATPAVAEALKAGYRSIDTAAAYGNEAGTGAAIAQSGVARDDVFVTTKLWNDDHGYDATKRAFDASMGKLGLDVLDLYLIHWPTPARDNYVDTWKAFVELQKEGRVRAIGVSNFQPDHLKRLIDETGVVPAVNQIEVHPYFQQNEVRAFNAQHGIQTEAWSPLGQGGELLSDPVVQKIALAHGKSAAQIVLRWHLQIGNVVIPKSVTPSRIQENIDVFDFELPDAEIEALSTLDRGGRIGPNPDELN